MKVKEGDVLICTHNDCKMELTVTKTCDDKTCGCDECELEVTCCGEPMKLKQK